MIDVDKFLEDIHAPMLEHSGAPQIVLGNQKIPPEHLQENRIVYNMIAFADSGPRHTVIEKEEVVDFDPEYWDGDEGFAHDIMRYVIFISQATLSFTGFGPEARTNISRLREWWYVPGLADRFMKDNSIDCVIQEVMNIDDRTTYLESDYERRFGFDVLLNFKALVAVRERTIEKIQLTGDIEKTIEL